MGCELHPSQQTLWLNGNSMLSIAHQGWRVERMVLSYVFPVASVALAMRALPEQQDIWSGTFGIAA